ncbi:MAG: hypothetical protein ACRDZ3_20785 [Acidimicrobiia bacterium]
MRRHGGGKGNWDHAMCPRCWGAEWGARQPARVDEGTPEICCFCGADTDSGIYVRRDPAVTPCQGGPGVPLLLFR